MNRNKEPELKRERVLIIEAKCIVFGKFKINITNKTKCKLPCDHYQKKIQNKKNYTNSLVFLLCPGEWDE